MDEYASSDDGSSTSDGTDTGDFDHSDDDGSMPRSDEEDTSDPSEEDDSTDYSDSDQEEENRGDRIEQNINRETEKERMKKRIHVLEMRVYRLKRTLTETKNQLKMESIKTHDFGKDILKSVEKIQNDAEAGKTKATFIMDQVKLL